MTLVELCAGSAAVSLRWLSPSGVPPLGYQGSKRAFADAILDAMGLAPGGAARNGRVVLVEAGPWGEAWALWRTEAGRRDTIERLRAWAAEDPRTLWEQLRAAPVPAGVEERVATWAVLQFWSFANKAVYRDGDRWRTRGFNQAATDRETYHAKRRAARLPTYGCPTLRLDVQLVRTLQALPDLSRVEVHHADARDIEPIPGAHVLIDPDYLGTTSYGHTLPRPDALKLAERWCAAGCTVAVCEAEPLPLEGWRSIKLPAPRGRGRPWSAQQAEWLTLSRPVAPRQADLWRTAG